MEEVEKKSKYSELVELIGKIDIEMQRSRDRQIAINEMRDVLYNEVMSPMKYQEKTEEMERAKKDKADFDERNKNALVNAKKAILQIKQDTKKEYQDKLLEISEKKKKIEEKLLSMKQKGLPAEKLLKAEEFASEAKIKVDEEMKQFQESYLELSRELETYEKKIRDYAVELGVKDEIDSVTLEENKEEPAILQPTEEPKKTSESTQIDTELSQQPVETVTETNKNNEEGKTKVKVRRVVVKKTASKSPVVTGKNKSNKEKVTENLGVESETIIGNQETLDSTVIDIPMENPKNKGKNREIVTDSRLAEIDTLISEMQPDGGDKGSNNVTDERIAQIDELVANIQGESQEGTIVTEEDTVDINLFGSDTKYKEDIETIQDIEILTGAFTGPISITFDAKQQQYELYVKRKTKKFSLESMLSDKRYQKFFEKFLEKLNHIKGLDPYVAYIISTSGVENSDKILDEYFDVMGNKTSDDKELNSVDIEYNMDGIYGRKYSPEMSSQIMSYANAHKEKEAATVKKGRFTKFLEKHDKIRGVWEKVSKIGSTQQLALPEGKVSSNNDAKRFREEMQNDKELPEKADIIITRIATCQSIDQLNDILEQTKTMSSLSEKDKTSINFAVSHRKTNLTQGTVVNEEEYDFENLPF